MPSEGVEGYSICRGLGACVSEGQGRGSRGAGGARAWWVPAAVHAWYVFHVGDVRPPVVTLGCWPGVGVLPTSLWHVLRQLRGPCPWTLFVGSLTNEGEVRGSTST